MKTYHIEISGLDIYHYAQDIEAESFSETIGAAQHILRALSRVTIEQPHITMIMEKPE